MVIDTFKPLKEVDDTTVKWLEHTKNRGSKIIIYILRKNQGKEI